MQKLSSIINLIQEDFIKDLKEGEVLEVGVEVYGLNWVLTAGGDSFSLEALPFEYAQLQVNGNLDFDPDPKISVSQVIYGDILMDEV